MKPRRPRKPSKPPTRSHEPSGKRKAKPLTPTPGKRSPTKRGRVDSDLDVFVASLPSSSRSGVAVHADTDDDDGNDVFVATPGRPIEVQADWTEDAGNATYADMLAQQPDGAVLTILPDAVSMAELGFVRNARAVRGYSCKYGCPGLVSDPPTIAAHHYACDYWRFEGRTKTPF